MRRLVLAPVVWMDSVRVVQREDERPLESALHRLALRRGAKGLGNAAHQLLHDRPARAARRRRAHLLVVEESDTGHVGVVRREQRGAIHEGFEADEARGEVIQAAPEDELAVCAPEGRRLRVEEAQVHGGNVALRHAQSVRDECYELGLLPARKGVRGRFRGRRLAQGREAEDRRHVGLLVGREGRALLRGLEVDAERGHAHHGLVHREETLPEGAVRALREHQAADAQVTIKPGVPQASAVGHHGELGQGLHRARAVAGGRVCL
mmetsp:Transcript_2859/g.8429  ORF Transcript_2859/g.8429 Transcript_2859/m.8429 type:complete len:265 (+) Transcript_2859:496-1290(+)